jgi:hypothetical protein
LPTLPASVALKATSDAGSVGNEMMILEGLVTTLNADGGPNISPMGPLVDEALSHLVLRPFQTSRTYQNLKRSGQGVFHVTDDVELLAKAAVNRLAALPSLIPAQEVEGFILADACRWFAFRVKTLDDRAERTHIECEVVARGTLRDFLGFNRAKHAVVEAAILATRVALLPAEQIRAEFARLAVIVEKTAGVQERRAFEFLRTYVDEALGKQPVSDAASVGGN